MGVPCQPPGRTRRRRPREDENGTDTSTINDAQEHPPTPRKPRKFACVQKMASARLGVASPGGCGKYVCPRRCLSMYVLPLRYMPSR